MWLLLPFCFGLLVPVHAHENPYMELGEIVPKTNLCLIQLIMCDDYKIQLTPVEKTYYKFYTEVKSLQKFCRKNQRFIQCTKNTIKLCKLVPQTRETTKLMESRVFAEVFCKPDSPWQRLYLENAGCVNSFAPAVEDVCGYKTVDLVLSTPTTQVREFCRSAIAMKECFIRMIRKACGIIAGDLAKRVLLYATGNDFICNKLEKETNDILQKFWFSPAKNYALKRDQTIRLFLTDLKTRVKLGMPIETPPPDGYFTTMQHEQPIASEVPVTTEMPQFTGYLGEETDFATTLNFEDTNVQEVSYFTETSPFDIETDPSSDEYSTQIPIPTTFTDSYTQQTLDTSTMFPPDGVYAYTNFTSFGLYEIMDNGDAFYLGCGTATVQWTTDLKLKNVLCGWVYAEATNTLFKCNIHLGEACIFEEYENSKNREINMASRKVMLVVFNLEKGTYQEVATMKMMHFKPENKAFTPVVDGKHSESDDAHDKNRPRTKHQKSFTEL
ncbi:hypothetical protein TNCT_384441 [Trichonephila clavata]|uniref:DUF19 domain-containing protein n=1 Tax=Trichonephila clavata TaxID=2740835 RepID=A0A8X6LP80_TRICU|nr:hypothetical protein TNCT_384441 [Trichonephila clavata]